MIVDYKTDAKAEHIVQWLKEWQEKDRLKQTMIDNDPNAQTLYTFEIDVDTLEIESNETKVLDYDEDVTGYAEYEESSEGRRVYAESLKSSNDAQHLVYDFCKKFEKAALKIKCNSHIVCHCLCHGDCPTILHCMPCCYDCYECGAINVVR